jgi:nitric oxide synthase-interacting protein
MDVFCPVTGKKLKMKDLKPIKFTAASDGVPNSFIDPVSNDALNNSSKLVALTATGDVMLEKTYNTCIKPDGIYKGMLLMALCALHSSRC